MIIITLYVPLCDRGFPVLDPRISYEGMKLDYENDSQLAEYLECSKKDLHAYYESHYANRHLAPTLNRPIGHTSQTPVSSSTCTPLHSPQKNFTLRFQRKTKAAADELEDYFKLPAEDFESCNPVHWWMGRRAQFPNLFWLVRDLLCIPGKLYLTHKVIFLFTKPVLGSAVAVERVFSGGRDTISLRRASLHPEPIKVLMLVKKKLHLARVQSTAALCR